MLRYIVEAMAVIEDVNDPERKGRVRARILGVHTTKTMRGVMDGIPTEDLPWVPVDMPAISSSSGGVGISPTGLQVGDRVRVSIRDEYYQDYTVTYTYYGKADVHEIAQGGSVGANSEEVQEANENRVYTQSPILKPSDKIEEDDNVDDEDFIAMIKYDEGFKSRVYKDSLGFPTIGVGHLLTKNGGMSSEDIWKIVERDLGKSTGKRRHLTNDEINELLRKDIRKIRSSIPRFPTLYSAYNSVGKARKYVLENMCFQMGVGGADKFKTTLGMIMAEDWDGAYKNILKSLWAKQTPNRANRVALSLRNGNLYHYPIPSNSGKRPPEENKPDLGDKPTTRMMSSRSLIPNFPNLSGESSGFDFSRLQGGLNKGFFKLMDSEEINTIVDVRGIVNTLNGINNLVSDVKEKFTEFKEKISNFSDIEVVKYYDKYLNKIKTKVGVIVNNVKQFAISTSAQSEYYNEIKLLAKGIEVTGEVIKYIVDDTRDDINETLVEISENPQREIEDNDSGVGFSEPFQEYTGEYPYVQTTRSKSGHSITMDDTPDFERLEFRHRSGSVDTVNPSGTRVQKIVGDGYILIEQNGYIDVSGTFKMNICGTANIQILGNLNQVVEGDVTQRIRGDVDQDIAGDVIEVIHGDVESLIHGNVKETIKGDVITNIDKNSTVNVKMDGEMNIEGNVTRNIKGNVTDVIEGSYTTTIKGDSSTTIEGSRTDKTSGDWNRESANVNDKSGGTHNITSSRINLNS